MYFNSEILYFLTVPSASAQELEDYAIRIRIAHISGQIRVINVIIILLYIGI